LHRDVVSPQVLFEHLKAEGVDYFTGVPDSLLKDFNAYVTDNTSRDQHVIAANEGAAVGMAAGYHAATGKVPLVYLQNSGLGNTVNPLLSLADPTVYSVPMLIVVGWRGEPGKRDEPQHLTQGKVTPAMLAAMNINFEVLPDYNEGAIEVVNDALDHAKRRKCPFVLLVKKRTFGAYKMQSSKEFMAVEDKAAPVMTREQFLETFLPAAGDWGAVVASTGFTSREVYELREKFGQDHSRDFLTVGSMGHSSAIGLGIAMAKPSRQVFVLDGDGALQMHMGTMVTVGSRQPNNFKHVVINNGCHESVGGQSSEMARVDIPGLAAACNYKHVFTATTVDEVEAAVEKLRNVEGPALLEARVMPGARSDLGRPKASPQENKEAFMSFLGA